MMRRDTFLPFALSAILGLCSAVIPGVLRGNISHTQSPFWAVDSGIDSPLMVLFLFVSGVIMGLFYPKRAWRWGIGTMALFPILTIIEGTMVPGTHNLLPFEIVFYSIATIPGVLGAVAGSSVRKKFGGERLSPKV